jgi:hypothetical protein
MHDREKQHLWTIFAAAATARGNHPKDAAIVADDMLKEYDKRFPPEPEDEHYFGSKDD